MRRTNAQIGSAIRCAVIAAGGKRNNAEQIVGNKSVLAKLAAIILSTPNTANQIKEMVIASITHSFTLLVDTTKSLADQITAGHYDYVNPGITAEHFLFQMKGKGKVKVDLWHPNKYFANGDEVIAELAKLNAELAEKGAGYRYRSYIEGLLVLGAAQPELQRSFPIGAMDSIWLVSDGGRRFACLFGGGAERFLYLGGIEGGFGVGWRFALVREQLTP